MSMPFFLNKILVVSLLLGVNFAWADDYADSLEAEARKIDQTLPPPATPSAATEKAERVAAQHRAFDNLLATKHRGTYAL